jgi:Ca2+-binding RTX toxin-like protein
MYAFSIVGHVTTGQTVLGGQVGRVLWEGALDTVGRSVTLRGELVNAGRITSQIGHAVVIPESYAAINTSGEITAARDVIYSPNITRGDISVFNSGSIIASSDVASAISLASGGLHLMNYGTIRSQVAPAVLLHEGSRTEVNVIINKGVISSAGYLCIRTDRSHDRMVNEGTIVGSIDLGDGTNTLRNKGTISGDIYSGRGADIIDMRDTLFDGRIYAGGRGDKVRGGEAQDTIFGQAGNDTIRGNGGDDVLSGAYGLDTVQGGDGNDTINGGMNADRLAGGAGQDVFVFNTLGTSTAFGRDHIADFQRGADKIDLSTIIARIEASPNGGPVQFIGTAEFTGDRQIRIGDFGNQTLVEFNNRGTTTPEFVLLVENVGTLTATDFIL